MLRGFLQATSSLLSHSFTKKYFVISSNYMGILFSILSAATFGICNYIDKFLLEKHNISPVVISIYGGVFAILLAIILFIFTGFYPIDPKSLLILLASGFFTTIYLPLYYKALTLDETSYVVPLLQTYPIFVLILGYVLLHEQLSVGQYIGAFLMIIAGILLSVETINGKLFRLRKSFFYIMTSAFLFAIAQVLYKFGVEQIPFLYTLPYEAIGIALGALSIALYKNNFKLFIKETRRFQQRVFWYLGLNEFIYVLARYTGYFAISLISVSLVSALAELQPLFVLIYGIILSLWFPYIIKESVTKNTIILKLASIFMIIIGAYFIV